MDKLPRRLTALFLGLALFVSARAENLLVNGDFSESLESGWNLKSTAYEPETFIVTGEPNWVTVRQSYDGYTRIAQQVDVNDLDLRLSFSARFNASVNQTGYGAASGVMVSYLSSAGELQARTTFIRAAGAEANLPGHIIPVKPSKNWSDFELLLSRDVAENHTGVSAEDIARVEIALFVDNGRSQAC